LPITPCRVLPSPQLDKVGTRKVLISEINGWPACAPKINATPMGNRSQGGVLVFVSA